MNSKKKPVKDKKADGKKESKEPAQVSPKDINEKADPKTESSQETKASAKKSPKKSEDKKE